MAADPETDSGKSSGASAESGDRVSRLARDYRVGLPARRAAVSLLEAVLKRGQPLDAAIAAETSHGELAALTERDRALARAIVATALRRKGQIDAILYSLLERRPSGRTGALSSILLAAAAQILFMETADHAVVNLAVHQIRDDRRSSRFAGLVNAVLRRVSERGPAALRGQDAALLNTPEWLMARWRTAYGEATAKRIAEAHLREAAVDLTVKADAPAWAAKLGGTALGGSTVRLEGRGRIEQLEGFSEGQWWVQDAAAALPARLLHPQPGERIADLCAAPGGKTAQLALAGAKVTAIDHSEKRIGIVARNLERLQLEAETVVGDVLHYSPKQKFDAVLLDAPCTATGTIRRHPDIPHLKTQADVDQLRAVQEKLLRHAASLVRPGGRLVYCTCSLEPEEGEGQARALLASGLPVASDPADALDLGWPREWISPEGWLRTLPSMSPPGTGECPGMDGFFAACFRIAG
ncbi:MAG: transcription antitermination factor NusB [Pseudomonadota bacterium]|nr:transcription antitermination factor NusB [Pseudomonadota bacterium]